MSVTACVARQCRQQISRYSSSTTHTWIAPRCIANPISAGSGRHYHILAQDRPVNSRTSQRSHDARIQRISTNLLRSFSSTPKHSHAHLTPPKPGEESVLELPRRSDPQANFPQTACNIHRQRRLITHLHRSRRRQPAGHSARQ